MSAIDQQVFELLRELVTEDDPDFLFTYIALFLNPIPERFKKMDVAIQTNDAKTLEKEAHALKSSAANTGATELSQLCADLERMSKQGNLDQAGPRLMRMRQVFEDVKRELELIVPGSTSKA